MQLTISTVLEFHMQKHFTRLIPVLVAVPVEIPEMIPEAVPEVQQGSGKANTNLFCSIKEGGHNGEAGSFRPYCFNRYL